MPAAFLDEVRTLAGAGFVVLEIAEHFGVDRSTMYRQRKFAPDFIQSLKEGRAAFVVLEADLKRLERAEEAAQTRQAAVEARALLETVEAPVAAHSTTLPLGEGEGSDRPTADGRSLFDGFEPAVDPLGRDYDGPGAALPMDDPLGRE